MKIRASFLALTIAAFFPIHALAQKVLDDFEGQSKWLAGASDGVSSVQSQVNGKIGKAIHMDYDFHNRSGYAYITRELPISFPENYEVSFYVRGSGPKNNFELKLKDKSGDNVWWKLTKDFVPSTEWQLVKFKKRQFAFAWGPTSDKELKQTQSLDFVISAGSGGKGFIEIDDLKITPLVPRPAVPDKIIASATSGDATLAIDDNKYSEWTPKTGDNNPQITFDLGSGREFGGVSLLWSVRPQNYVVEITNDNKEWSKIATSQAVISGYDFIRIKDGDAKKVRISIKDNSANLKEAIFEPLQYGEDDNAYFQQIATYYPRGIYPRALSGEEEFWTLVGPDGGKDNGLISEDGRIEIGRGGFSIAPEVRVKRDVKDLREMPFDNFNWANVKIEHELMDNYLPIPSAIWRTKDFDLKITSFADPLEMDGKIYGIYEITNKTNKVISPNLILKLSPFQVNGPLQFLAVNGGASPISSMAIGKDNIKANGKNVGFSENFAQSKITDMAQDAYSMPNVQANSPWHQGVMQYDLKIAPKQSKKIAFIAPISNNAKLAQVSVENVEVAKSNAALYWRNKLNQVQISANGSGQEIANAIKTNMAYILMMREGAMLKPGTRSYNRSWIRDGAMISETLLRMGLQQEAKDYLAWFTPFQFDNGKIPCCADFRGSDPVPENDSHGEYIYLVNQIYKYTHDKAILEKYWPNVKMAFDYINSQRALERNEKNETAERKQLYGLMSPTISHEGYSDKIAYSNWDNFWTLRGMSDAVEIASVLEKPENEQMNLDRFEFESDLKNAIELAQKKYKFDYIPGAQDRGDFDATSTTIALLLELGDRFPQEWFVATFDKYWENFVKRRDIDKGWKDYTPYEWRVVSAFTRLEMPKRAQAASQFFLDDRLPKKWNAFAEVVGREKRTPRYLGDLPHGWVASDFIRSSLDRFFFEEPGFEAILGGGIDPSWLNNKGVSIQNLSTSVGKLSFKMRYINGILTVETKGAQQLNFVVRKHLIAKNTIIFNGKKIKTNGGDFTLFPPVEMK